MDATQKRRMWKVAIVHLTLSGFCILGALHTPYEFHDFWLKVFITLHPAWVVLRDFDFPWTLSCILAIPLWSFCFGWIFVKLDNWLNHFPVLGKRVF